MSEVRVHRRYRLLVGFLAIGLLAAFVCGNDAASHWVAVDGDAAVAARRNAENIIRSGRLTPANVEALSVQLQALPWADALAIRRRLADAINKRQLVPTEAHFTLP